MSDMEVQVLQRYIENHLDLHTAHLPDEYFYTSVVQCVIDAVFSIGVRYEGVRNVVRRFSEYAAIEMKREGSQFPSVELQYTVDDFLNDIEVQGIQTYANLVFKNKQKTSTRSGILKTEAVYEFCKVLKTHGVQTLQDVQKLYVDASFETEIKTIPGQKSGISLVYFYMLAGEDTKVKPDRMIVRFLEKALSRKVDLNEAQPLLVQVNSLLRPNYPNLNPRLLDYVIWSDTRNSIP